MTAVRQDRRAPSRTLATAPSPATFLDTLLEPDSARAEALGLRVRTVLESLGDEPIHQEPAEMLATLERVLGDGGRDEIWLALAVIIGRLPEPSAVLRASRAARLDGPVVAIYDELLGSGELEASAWASVEVVTGRVLVDVHHTARAIFATGIQRVTRELARRWERTQDPLFIGWTKDYQNLCRLSPAGVQAALNGLQTATTGPDDTAGLARPDEVLVPWRCTEICPELPAEPVRARRYQGFVKYSKSVTGLVGHDCVPLMGTETCAEGMSGGFAEYLAAAAAVDRIATVSGASATEYRGWREMLSGRGIEGPEIRPIPLAWESVTPNAEDIDEARSLIGIGPLPIVLSVGSHEPRKNHLVLLHAAELLWREGHLFTLAFVGGNSWNSDDFKARVAELNDIRRPVQTVIGLPDRVLWAAYRIAYCTVFPSLHEGFGLPVVESLASGTPVITSDYGSMRENARYGGALLVDPRDPHDLAGALRRLLTDPGLRARLAEEAGALPPRSWDDYAAETWKFFVEGE